MRGDMAEITPGICRAIIADSTNGNGVLVTPERGLALAQAWLDHEAQVASLRVQLTEAQVAKEDAQREAHERAVAQEYANIIADADLTSEMVAMQREWMERHDKVLHEGGWA
jgi:hypothetical protein